MLDISNEARLKRQNVYINLQRIYASEEENFKRIWNLVLENETENRFDSPFTSRILSCLNNDTSLKKFLNEVLDDPESIKRLPKPRYPSNLPSTDSLADRLKNLNVKPTFLAPQDSLHETPVTFQYYERLRTSFSIRNYEEWLTIAETKVRVDDQDKYCDTDLAKQIVVEKEDMALYTKKEKHIMRQTANEYEKVKGSFFQNREAMKLASLDHMFKFDLTKESVEAKRLAVNPMKLDQPKTNEFSRNNDTFFFADVGGGPGAHTEYILWRKGYYNAKGFGCTMKDKYPTQPKNMGDYKRKEFAASSFAFFDTYYGVKENGDICDPENLKSFEAYVKERTDGKGVHLVIADGAIDPDGRETRQELFHNRLFLCEFIAALSLCRIDEGNFVCKLYDTVCPFTVGLLYLMWIAFDEIAICKPVSVRPACSEKFLVCRKLTTMGATVIKVYLVYVNEQFGKLPEGMDVAEVVPKIHLERDTRFVRFMMEHNRKVFLAQIKSLKFYKSCLRNPNIAPKNQDELRAKALECWNIPDISRVDVKKYDNVYVVFETLSNGFGLNRFYHLLAYDSQSTFQILPNFRDTHIILQEFYIQMLTSTEHRILISDDRGYIHLLVPRIPYIKNIKNVEYHGFPPRSIVLIQHVKENFGPHAQEHPLRIVDAAVLAGDDISNLPVFSRLKHAKKFAQNVVIRFDGKRIPLEVIPAVPLNITEVKKFAENSYGVLKIFKIYKKNFNLIWNRDKQCEEIVLVPSGDLVAEEKKHRTYSSFWDTLFLSYKISDWRNSRSGFIDTIMDIHRKFCARNGLSDTVDS